MNAKGPRPRFTGQAPLGIAISDSLEKTGNWDAGHLNYAFLSPTKTSRGSWNSKDVEDTMVEEGESARNRACIKRNARIDRVF